MPKELDSLLHRYLLNHVLFTIPRTWKQLKCPSAEERAMKICCIYTMEYYSAVRKHENVNFSGKWMELGKIIL